MTYEIRWSRPAIRELQGMDRQIAARVRAAVRRYATTQEGDIKRLQGQGLEYRLRVGNWRVRFTLDPEQGIMEILRVLPRGRAYRD